MMLEGKCEKKITIFLFAYLNFVTFLYLPCIENSCYIALLKRFRVAGVAKRVRGGPTKHKGGLTLIAVQSFILPCSSSNFFILTKFKFSRVLVHFPLSPPVTVFFFSIHACMNLRDDIFCKSINLTHLNFIHFKLKYLQLPFKLVFIFFELQF